jgi:hypothetical protein
MNSYKFTGSASIYSIKPESEYNLSEFESVDPELRMKVFSFYDVGMVAWPRPH